MHSEEHLCDKEFLKRLHNIYKWEISEINYLASFLQLFISVHFKSIHVQFLFTISKPKVMYYTTEWELVYTPVGWMNNNIHEQIISSNSFKSAPFSPQRFQILAKHLAVNIKLKVIIIVFYNINNLMLSLSNKNLMRLNSWCNGIPKRCNWKLSPLFSNLQK